MNLDDDIDLNDAIKDGDGGGSKARQDGSKDGGECQQTPSRNLRDGQASNRVDSERVNMQKKNEGGDGRDKGYNQKGVDHQGNMSNEFNSINND